VLILDIVARFEVPFYQYINEESQPSSDLPHFAKEKEHLLRLYRLMVLNRVFDTKAIALQRTGKMGTYPSTRGQEAVFVGIGDAMAKNDVLVPYYRDAGILTQRGVKFSEILLYWGGDERGNQFSCGGEDLPYSVPVGSQPLHAAGIATAFRLRNEKRAVVSMCGEGASSQGDFYEAMNVAGVWKLPVVFIVSNNQWAISVSRDAQTAAQTFAQKAIAAGFEGEQVDGNDVIAVRERTDAALKKAREKNEPTLLEIISYRQHDHTTADDASRYEMKDVREKEWKKEPLARLKKYIENLGIWSAEQEEKLQAECAAEVEKSVEEYLSVPPAPLESMFDYLYAELPGIYADQREQVRKLGETHG
jgi:2-oxoisovalerate dehydrogenase E1 component alpha subunit